MAKCQGCKIELIEENSAPSVVKRGRGRCKSCANSRMRKIRKDNPKSFILYGSRQRSNVSGIENTLILKDIPDIPEFCPVFPWIRLSFQVGKGYQDCSPSLDRIDNTKGYIKGNIRIISNRANLLKRDATPKELVALGLDATKRKTCNKPHNATVATEQSGTRPAE